MIYPVFLKKNDLIGMTALSGGCKEVLAELNASVKKLENDYQVILSSDVTGPSKVSASVMKRAEEFNNLLNEDIKMIYIARGGNFLIETLPYLDYDLIKRKAIWIQGYSDPTSLLYFLTTKYDLATIYGLNGKSYDDENCDYQQNNLAIIQGNLIEQGSFPGSSNQTLYTDFTSEGVLIGGCIEVLRNLIGTKYDSTDAFLERYRDKKIIWYFDIYNSSSMEVYLTLWQFKNASWFRYSDTFLFGTVMFPNEDAFTYEEAFKRVFDATNHVVYHANIGHVKPSFTLINGSYARISYQDNRLRIRQELLEDK